MVESIRPHVVLDRVPEKERRVNFVLPNSSSGYMCFEAMILLALEKTVCPRKIFEFGTLLGETTLHLAMNSPGDVDVVTLDLGAEDVEKTNLDQRERALADRAVENEPRFAGEVESSRIKRIFGNSCSIDLSEHFNTCQFVYVDGGHTTDVIKADTENAFRLFQKDAPGIVAWHDYGNPDYPDVKEYLDALSDSIKIYSVCETMIAFHAVGL